MAYLKEELLEKSGMPPGTLVHIGEKKSDTVQIAVMDYDESHLWESEMPTPEEFMACKTSSSVTWISVNGLHVPARVESLGKYFNLHSLLLEDILHTGQRPKIDEYDNHLYVVARVLTYDQTTQTIHQEQVSLVLGENLVISFSEKPRGLFNPIRERLRKDKSRIRKMGAEYLLYALLDVIVDDYFVLLKMIEESLENLEDELMEKPGPETLQEIYHMKKQTMSIGKLIQSMSEYLWELSSVEPSFFAA
ncbi:MAG: hypothetical protein HQM12_16070 [SAR324 cluster bacterium]|nr:hypothetical protein [SAR324 cluster bacterium]